MFTSVLGRNVASSLISTQTFRTALTASVDSCVEIKSARVQWRNLYSGRIWRKIAESDAWSVENTVSWLPGYVRWHFMFPRATGACTFREQYQRGRAATRGS